MPAEVIDDTDLSSSPVGYCANVLGFGVATRHYKASKGEYDRLMAAVRIEAIRGSREFIEEPDGLYWWQQEALSWVDNISGRVKGSVCTPNGSGKSSKLIAGLALYWLSVHKNGRVVITTKDSKQLDNQIWPAIEAHQGRFPGYRFIEREVHTPSQGFIIGFTTDDPGRAEGWHKMGDLDGPLLIIVDEAKSVDEKVFQALDRCTYNAIIYVSSPGFNSGRFFESQEKLKKSAERPLGFNVIKVGLADCPHIPKDRIDDVIDSYGVDHPFTQSTLFGEFMDEDADTMFIFNRGFVRTNMNHPPSYVHGNKGAFCDFAAGGNENSITFKEGNKYEQVNWRDANVMSSIGRFLIEFKKRDLLPSETYGDAGGMGIVIIQRFHEMGWPIVPVYNDAPATNPIYENLGAQNWHEAAIRVSHQLDIMPNDEVLFDQLTSRKIKFTSDGLLGNESKKDMHKRGVESPDRADSYVGAVSIESAIASSLFEERGLQRLEGMARGARAENGKLTAGAQQVIYEAGAQDAWLSVWERPIVRQNYLVVVNPLRHGEGIVDHVVMVLRSSTDEKGKPLIRMVAKVRRPCKLDAAPLAQMVKLVSRWYGNANCIPIVQERGDVIEELLRAGLPVYSREEFERFRFHGRPEVVAFGWESDDYTRSMWIGSLAEAVRTDSLEVYDVETVMQVHQLTTGNAETKREAEALGVGLNRIGFASTYASPQNPNFSIGKPKDLSKAMFS